MSATFTVHALSLPKYEDSLLTLRGKEKNT